MLARMAVATAHAERILTIVLGTNQFLDCKDESPTWTHGVPANRDHVVERPEVNKGVG